MRVVKGRARSANERLDPYNWDGSSPANTNTNTNTNTNANANANANANTTHNNIKPLKSILLNL